MLRLHARLIGGGPEVCTCVAAEARRERNQSLLERNRTDDNSGGVVFSDQTLAISKSPIARPRARSQCFNHWDDSDQLRGGLSAPAARAYAESDKRLPAHLQPGAKALGVEVCTQDFVRRGTAPRSSAHIVVLARHQQPQYCEVWATSAGRRHSACRFVCSARTAFSAFTFAFENTEPAGSRSTHTRTEARRPTFIVEARGLCRRAGLAGCLRRRDRVRERLFAAFRRDTVLINAAICGLGDVDPSPARDMRHVDPLERAPWQAAPIVLLGDAAHTAHFSIGSGTKLAFEDAIALERALDRHGDDLPAALAAYEAERSIEVLKIQNAARNSTEWFENVERYTALEAEQFAYSLLTRSQRISHENLRLRDRDFVERMEAWFAAACERSRAPQGARSPWGNRAKRKGGHIERPGPPQGARFPSGEREAHRGSQGRSAQGVAPLGGQRLKPRGKIERAPKGPLAPLGDSATAKGATRAQAAQALAPLGGQREAQGGSHPPRRYVPRCSSRWR